MCNQFRVHTRCASFRLFVIAMWLFCIDPQFFFILEFPGCSKGVEFKPRKCPIQLNSFNFFACKCNINNPSSKCTLVLFRSQKNNKFWIAPSNLHNVLVFQTSAVQILTSGNQSDLEFGRCLYYNELSMTLWVISI